MKRNSLLLILLGNFLLQTSLWAQSNAVFDQYAWLTDLVDPANCSDEAIAVYNAGSYDFLLVTDAAGTQRLYLDNGTFYCQNSPNYDCVAAYNLSNLTNTWDCTAAGPTPPPPTIADDPIFTEYPWLSTVVNTDDCGTASLVEYASGAYTFLAIDNGNGIEQLFFENGTLYCTSAPNYDCVTAYNLNEVLRTWSCGSTTDEGNGDDDTQPMENEDMDDGNTNTPTNATDNDPLFTNFPWLLDIIGGTCTSESVTVYQQGSYQYLIVTDPNGVESMYFQDGSFYCQSGSGLDCKMAYNLNTAIYNWSCGSDTAQPDCNRYTGTIVFQNCDNGQLYNFIRTADGQLLDIYFPLGTNFALIEGQSVKFDYQVASFNSPCSAASQAVNVTCITTNNDDPNAGDCTKHTGTFFFRNCDDGTPFVFIQTTDGTIYDPYFDGNISYTPVQGQRVNFDFTSTNFSTPCSIADQAITITCLEIDNTELPAGNCASNRGEMFFQTCADGNRYFLIRTEDGQILDPYYGPGVNFSEYDGQVLQFDYVDAGFPTGCSAASKAVTITCIEEIIPEGFTNGIPENYENYDVIYRICRGETLRLENLVRSIQCNCPENPQGPCDNFPFNQWGKWDGGPLVDNTDHILVSPTTTTVYENQINGYFCGIAGPTFGPTNKVTYLVIVEVSQDCALPNATLQTTFDVSGCVGDIIRVPAPSADNILRLPNPDICLLDAPNITNGVVEVLTIEEHYLEVQLLQAGTFNYSVYEGEDDGLSCPVANYVYNVSIDNCINSSTPITKIFDYRVCIGEVVDILRPTPSNCANNSIPISNDIVEVIDANENFLKVKVLKVGSFTMSNNDETMSDDNCQQIIHDFSFVTHADCQDNNFDASTISNNISLNKAIFNVYPNPSEGLLHIPVQGLKDQAQQIRLLDLNGRTIQETLVPASSTMMTTAMNLANIADGVYLIEISSEGQRSVQRVVKQ